jgi:SAM-dependent methyltransferase
MTIDPAAYGDVMADIEAQPFNDPGDADEAVEFLADLAGDGPVLELGLGLGRMAVPLAARGLRVHGIEASDRMVTLLRRREGADRVRVHRGNFAEVSVEGRFRLIFAVFNTFLCLGTQEEQLRCFQRAAAKLEAGGHFVLQAFVPDPARLAAGHGLSVERVDRDILVLSTARIDMAAQRIHAAYVVLGSEGSRFYPFELRYAWPSELDLMAHAAGLERVARYADWDRRPFGNGSPFHVSVYQRSC